MDWSQPQDHDQGILRASCPQRAKIDSVNQRKIVGMNVSKMKFKAFWEAAPRGDEVL